jgi:hypothetical protein
MNNFTFCTEHALLKKLLKMKLPSRIAVFGMEKAPSWCRNLLSLAHTGILHSSVPEMFFGLRSRTCCADAGRFRKSLKIKITGKRMGRGNPGRHFQQ